MRLLSGSSMLYGAQILSSFSDMSIADMRAYFLYRCVVSFIVDFVAFPVYVFLSVER